jgi:hypothetical protein
MDPDIGGPKTCGSGGSGFGSGYEHWFFGYILLQAMVFKEIFQGLNFFYFADRVVVILSQVTERGVDSLPEKLAV